MDVWGVFTAVVSFFILVGVSSDDFSLSSLGAISVFLAMVTAILSSLLYYAVYKRMSRSKKLYSYGADSRLNSAVNALLPSAVTVGAAAVIMYRVTLTGSSTVHDLLVDVFVGFFNTHESLFGQGFLFVLLSSVLWCFGIHGSDCLESVASRLFVPLLDVNVQAVAAGQAPTEILCKPFFDCFILMGGCGSSICLLLAILFFSKDRGMRDIARTAAFPMLFNINELMVFGLPIVFNPLLFVPFITVPVLQYLVTYVAMSTGLVPLITAGVEWTTPVLIGGYAVTGSIAGALLQVVNIVIGVAIYMPFVRMMGRVQVDRETANREAFIAWYKENESRLQAIHLTGVRGIYGEISRKMMLELHSAVKNKHYALFYQPQYNYEGECFGVEALLRWPDDEWLAVYPPILIQLAKEDGILRELEENILQMAFRDREKVYAKFGRGIKISVNVTGTSITGETYWQFLKQKYREDPFTEGKLCIEITEQDAVTFDSTVLAHFRECKEMGIQFAIDDFSAGQTSVHYLKEGIFDMIKLDGALVLGLNTNPRCREIISSLVILANSLGIVSLAEYVETDTLRAALHEVGCDHYQGYLFSPAIPLKEQEEVR